MFTQICKKYMSAYFFIFCIALQTVAIKSDTIVVTSEDSSGTGTLRDALSIANDGDTIVFAPNIHLITLLSPLPTITQNDVTIDGLAMVMGGTILEGDCSTFPSPVDDQSFFSAALRVTIDGSAIEKNIFNRGIALEITGDNVSLIGLRIQNFNGQILSEEGSQAVESIQAAGISYTNVSPNSPPTIQCCEITNIISGKRQGPIETGDATGISIALLVDKCLVQNISSLSSFDTDVEIIGSSTGIESAQTITNSVITNIERGSSINSTLVKDAIGISTNISDLPFSETTIQNCMVKNISGGSLDITTNITPDNIGRVSGVFISSNSLVTTTIQNLIICAINGGTINIDSTDQEVAISPVEGLHISRTTTTVSNTCITRVSGYTITVSGNNNLLRYPQVIGSSILSTDNAIVQKSTIDTICGNNITMTGSYNNAFLDLFNSSQSNNCLPVIPFSVIGIAISGNQSQHSHIVNNNLIQNIGTSHYTVDGVQSQFLGSGSVGIVVGVSVFGFFKPLTNFYKNIINTTSVITNNTLTSITGPTYFVQPDSLQTMQLNGTAGMYIEDFFTRISNNSIQKVTEGSMRVTSDKPLALYGLPLGVNLTNSLPATTVPFLPVYTNGITVAGTNGNSSQIDMNAIVIKNNIIKEITGSHNSVQTITQDSYATGIIAQPSLDQVEVFFFKQLPQCANSIGEITNNTIKSIRAHTNSASYGVFINGSSVLLESAIANQNTPLADCRLRVQENNISSLSGTGTINPLYIASTQTTLLPFLPSEPTNGIFSLFGGCSELLKNTITKINAPLTRGITSVASSDMEISVNTIFKTDGPGIFVGGASANPIRINNSGSFDQQEFEQFFPSVRNKIYSNSTYANAGEGIQLGVIDWNNFFASIPLLGCAPQFVLATKNTDKGGPVEIEIVGNHNQPAPHIARVVCNNNGTITIEVKFSDPNHPNSEFIIQFFRNSSNDIPHGEQLISNFDNAQFTLTTNENGLTRKVFTFVPAAEVESTDIISAHVTLTIDGSVGSTENESEDIGDTSEFKMEVTKSKDPACHLQKNSKPRMQFCYRK